MSLSGKYVVVFLSLHIKEYFEYFIRQLRLFTVILFPDVHRIENFLFEGATLGLKIGFQRLIHLIHFERIGSRHSEKHLTGFFTLRRKPIAGKILNRWSKSL